MFGRKADRYDEDEDQEESQQVFYPAESTGWIDWTIATGLGLLAFVGLTMFSFPGLSPEVWDDAAVAAGLRPPANVVSGLWRVIASWLYGGGAASGSRQLMFAGRLCGALTVGCSYLMLRSMLTLASRSVLHEAAGRFLIQRLACGIGAIFFICADPVWRAGQTFSSSGLLLLLSLVAGALFARFLLDGRLWKMYLSVFVLGALIAETPLGFVLLLVFGGVWLCLLRRGNVCDNMPLLDPIVGQTAKWRLTAVGALAFVGMIALNCASFIQMKGLTACAATGADLPLMYAKCWWGLIIGAASGMGWILGLAICVLPFAVAASMLARGLDEENFLPYPVGAVFFFTGVLGFAQVSEISPLWFWTWSEQGVINSALLHQAFLLLSVFAVVLALVVLGCDACCRNHVRLAQQRFSELEIKSDDGSKKYWGRPGGWIVLMIVLVVLLIGVLPGRRLPLPREMLSVVNDYVQEVIAEAGDVKWLFTDGGSDGAFAARFELAAAEKGKTLIAQSMMSGNLPYEQYLRLRHVDDAEDRMSFEIGSSTALWSWVHDKHKRLAETATQLGFEMWKKKGGELPVCSGVLARPAGMSEADCAAGVKRANALADRVLKFYTKAEKLPRAAGPRLCSLFHFVQWRLARLARMRAERADRAGNVNVAKADVAISDKLDDKNAELKRIMADLAKVRETTLRQVSPREGLQLALVRADFALARKYAEPILEQSKDDASANFAMAMSYYSQKQWNRAEAYFKACLRARPKEAAAWNNLAIVYINLKRLKAARYCVKQALSILPDSADVKDTQREVEEAIRKNGGNADDVVSTSPATVPVKNTKE